MEKQAVDGVQEMAKRLASQLGWAGTHWLAVVEAESRAQVRALMSHLAAIPHGPSLQTVQPTRLGYPHPDAVFSPAGLGPILLDLVRDDLHCAAVCGSWDHAVQECLALWNQEPDEALGPGLVLVLPQRLARHLPTLAPALWQQRRFLLRLPPPNVRLALLPIVEPPLRVSAVDVLQMETELEFTHTAPAHQLCEQLRQAERGSVVNYTLLLNRLSAPGLDTRFLETVLGRTINLGRSASCHPLLRAALLETAATVARQRGQWTLETRARTSRAWLALETGAASPVHAAKVTAAASRLERADRFACSPLVEAALVNAALMHGDDDETATSHLRYAQYKLVAHGDESLPETWPAARLVVGLVHARWGRVGQAIQALDAAVVGAATAREDSVWMAAIHALLELLFTLERHAEAQQVLLGQSLAPHSFVHTVQQRADVTGAMRLALLCVERGGEIGLGYRSVAEVLLTRLSSNQGDHPGWRDILGLPPQKPIIGV